MYITVQEIAELIAHVPFIFDENDVHSEEAQLTLNSVAESYDYSKMNHDHRGNLRTLEQKQQNFIDLGIIPETALVRGFNSIGIPASLNPVAKKLRKYHSDYAWDFKLFDDEATIFLELKHQKSLQSAVFSNWRTQSCFISPTSDFYLMWLGDINNPATVRTHAVLDRELFKNPSYWEDTTWREGGLVFNYASNPHRELSSIVRRHVKQTSDNGLLAF